MKNAHNAYQNLSVDEDDAIARTPRRKPRRMPTFQRNVLAVLVLVALCGYSLFHYRHLPKTTDPTPSRPPASVVADAPEIAPLPLNETQRRSQTLPECMGSDNLIDEAVVTCRFGKSQKAVTGSTAQGMVSARYMSQYKSQQQMHQPRLAAAQFIESAIVWQWDRKRTYALNGPSVAIKLTAPAYAATGVGARSSTGNAAKARRCISRNNANGSLNPSFANAIAVRRADLILWVEGP